MAVAVQPRHVGPFTIREVEYAPGLRQPKHVHAEMGVTLVVRGTIREVACGREEIATALSVVVKPPDVEHADEIGPLGARTLQILFDVMETRPLLGNAHGLHHWSWLHARAIAAEMLALLRDARRMPAVESDDLENRVIDVLGAAALQPLARGMPPRWIATVKEALDDAGQGRVSVIDLARDAGAHAVSVSRAFRRHFGCSISEYRRCQRLRSAATAIESSPQTLSRIAYATGFADHAHLAREFRATMGVTPSEFRKLASDVA